MAPSKPSKVVTISYDRETYESLPKCIQKHVTEQQWEEMQQEYDERKSTQDKEYNLRSDILTLEDLERQEKERCDAQPCYKDSKSALQAMKQYLKLHPPLPTVGSGESVREHHARVRKHFKMRRMAEIKTAMAREDAESKCQTEGGNGIKAASKGDKVPGVVSGSTHGSGAKAHEEEDDWVIVPTTIVKSKCQDGGLSQSESEGEYDEESDEENEEEDVNEEEALRSIAGPAPRHQDQHIISPEVLDVTRSWMPLVGTLKSQSEMDGSRQKTLKH